MYAKLKDGQLTDRTDGKTITLESGAVICNPSEATLKREGYYTIPAVTGPVESWAVVKGKLVPTYLPEPPPMPRIFSKLKLVSALMQIGAWDQVKSYIDAQGMTDLYLAAQVVAEDNKYFSKGLATLKEQFGLTDDQVESILSECVAD